MSRATRTIATSTLITQHVGPGEDAYRWQTTSREGAERPHDLQAYRREVMRVAVLITAIDCGPRTTIIFHQG